MSAREAVGTEEVSTAVRGCGRLCSIALCGRSSKPARSVPSRDGRELTSYAHGGTEPGSTAAQVMAAVADTIGPKSSGQLGNRRGCPIQLPEAAEPSRQTVCLVQKDELSCLLWWQSVLVSQSWPWSEPTAEPTEQGGRGAGAFLRQGPWGSL